MALRGKQKNAINILKGKAGNVSLTCEELGISRQTFYRWKDESKEFKKAVKDVEEGLIDFVESKLMKNIKEGKETSMIFFLKTKGKDRGYIEKTEIKHSGGLNVPPIINVQIVKNGEPHQLEK